MQQNRSKLNVLVVEPSTHMGGLIAAMFRTLQVRNIRLVSDVGAATAELLRRPYDLMLVDDSASVDGVAITTMLRGTEDGINRNSAVIMMSSAPDKARITAARDAGVTEFLRKPFAAAHIESRLITLQKAPREFIAAPDYVGPDRRRHDADPKAPKRRAADKSAAKPQAGQPA